MKIIQVKTHKLYIIKKRSNNKVSFDSKNRTAQHCAAMSAMAELFVNVTFGYVFPANNWYNHASYRHECIAKLVAIGLYNTAVFLLQYCEWHYCELVFMLRYSFRF